MIQFYSILFILFVSPDLSKNNITQINVDNFKGQQNLLELNLSKNKLDRMPSSPFQYLVVSRTRILLKTIKN